MILYNFNGFAQEKKPEDQKTDSLQFYHSLEKISKKGKLYNRIFRTIFNDYNTPMADSSVKVAYSYELYRNKIVREIVIETLDPFGYDLYDTLIKPKSVFQKTGDFIHNKSTKFAIKNQLLFHEGEQLDPYKLKESERLLRATAFVKDVKISVQEIPGTDSIDIFIREQDLWTITGAVSLLDSKKSSSLEDKNFAGLGHDFEINYYYYPVNRTQYFTGRYFVPSIKNSFISTELFYSTNKTNFADGVSVKRPFFSPLTKWAGGIDFIYRSRNQSDDILLTALDSIKYNDLDIWLGRSFPIRKSENENHDVTNFILTGRYVNHRSYKLSSGIADTSDLTANSKLYLTSFGLSRRSYYRDYFIYRFGIPEDVPAGSILQVLIGVDNGKISNRLYCGIQAGLGNHFGEFGYMSLRMGYGNFFNDGKLEQGVFDFNLGYFSNLLRIGNWNVRQFAKVHSVYGTNRRSNELVNINDENGINGFEASIPDITNKIVIQFQTQIYLPYEFIGFRFAPFLYCNLAMTGNEAEPYFNNRTYSAFGVGLLLKNELLVWNTFQFSIGLYPYIPGDGNWIFKFNPVKSYDFTFRDFDFSKPSLIEFQ